MEAVVREYAARASSKKEAPDKKAVGYGFGRKFGSIEDKHTLAAAEVSEQQDVGGNPWHDRKGAGIVDADRIAGSRRLRHRGKGQRTVNREDLRA